MAGPLLSYPGFQDRVWPLPGKAAPGSPDSANKESGGIHGSLGPTQWLPPVAPWGPHSVPGAHTVAPIHGSLGPTCLWEQRGVTRRRVTRGQAAGWSQPWLDRHKCREKRPDLQAPVTPSESGILAWPRGVGAGQPESPLTRGGGWEEPTGPGPSPAGDTCARVPDSHRSHGAPGPGPCRSKAEAMCGRPGGAQDHSPRGGQKGTQASAVGDIRGPDPHA